MLTKEEVIILRTIFLEFGDKEHRQSHLKFPYENLVVESNDKTKGSKPMANLGPLIDNLKSFGQPDLDGVVFDYYLGDNRDNCIDRLVIFDGKRRMEGVENWAGDDATETLNSLIFLKDQSKSTYFVNLRMGLYYKGIVDHEKSEKYLFAAKQEYMNILSRTVEQGIKNLEEFFDKNYDFEKGSFKETFIPGEDYPVKIEMPIELLSSLEETPSFHLGEVYLDQGEELSCAGKTVEAQNMFEQSVKYFVESEKVFDSIFYGKESDNTSFIPSILRELQVITGFPENVFQRNYYLERNLTSLRGSFYPIPKTDTEWNQVTKVLLDATRPPSRNLEKIEPIPKNRKQQIRNQCQKEYPFWSALEIRSQEFIVGGLYGQEVVDRWVGIVGLANALEKELTEKILKKLPPKVRKNRPHPRQNLGVGEFRALIKNNFAKCLFKNIPSNINGFDKSLETLGELRNEKGAHAGKIPSSEDNATFTKILLKGNDKEKPLLQAILDMEVRE